MAEITRLPNQNEPGKAQVIAMLHEAISDIESGKLPVQKAMLICLDEGDDPKSDKYDRSFRNAGLRMSEAIALCELTKTVCIDLMLADPELEDGDFAG